MTERRQVSASSSSGMKQGTQRDISEPELPSLAQMTRALLYMALAFLMMGVTWHKLGFMPSAGMWGTWGLGVLAGRMLAVRTYPDKKEAIR